MKITPHMMRHSGPSHDAWTGVRELAEIQKLRRWEAFSSVRRYEKHGKLLRVLAKVPTNIKKGFATGEKHIETVICDALFELAHVEYKDKIVADSKREMAAKSQVVRRSERRRT